MPNVQINIGKLSARGFSPSGSKSLVSDVRAQMKELETIFKDFCDQIEAITPDILLEAMQPTFDLAAYYCPKKTGALVESEYLEITSYRGKPRVELGFAKGGDPPYAIFVHEMIEYHHEPPTRSKFLQAAVNEDLENIQDRVVAAYRSAMKGKG